MASSRVVSTSVVARGCRQGVGGGGGGVGGQRYSVFDFGRRGGSVGRAADSRSKVTKDRRLEPRLRQEHKKHL